jgi:tetratricopeptide (TPR) repeat protein
VQHAADLLGVPSTAPSVRNEDGGDAPSLVTARDAPETTQAPENKAGDWSPTRHLVNMGVIIAVAGLLFSAATYFFNRQDQNEADERQARNELTEIVGQMAALPRQYDNLLVPSDPQAAQAEAGHFRAELVVLVSQAERLSSDYPSIVGAEDVYTIGDAHRQLGNNDLALASFTQAAKLALEEGDALIGGAARSGAGQSLFKLDRFDDGRKMFRRAIAHTGFDVPQYEEESQEADILAGWAASELEARGGPHCPEARQLVAELESSRFGSAYADQVRPNLERLCP